MLLNGKQVEKFKDINVWILPSHTLNFDTKELMTRHLFWISKITKQEKLLQDFLQKKIKTLSPPPFAPPTSPLLEEGYMIYFVILGIRLILKKITVKFFWG